MTRPHPGAPGAPGTSGAPGAEPLPDSWEAVLAGVEADVRRAEALVEAPPVSSARALTPAELMMPAAEEPVLLPPLSQMPPVPLQLVERITTLRARITELQADLERCLAAARRTDQLPARPLLMPPAVEQPHFVDRRA